ncbi:hypothetical protein Tco_0500621 [Tanacetum coccineum]
MADSSSHKPSSPEITRKEEPVPLDKPESPNPFLPIDQVEFIFEEIAFTTNNEVTLLYPSHSNSEYFIETLNDSKIWVSTPTGGIRADIGYSGEIRAKGTLKKSYLPLRFISLLLKYMMPEYKNKELTINPTQVFSIHNWALKPNQTKGPPFTNHMKAIYNLDLPMDPKAPKPSSQTEEFSQGQKPKPSLTPTPVVGEMHKEVQQAVGGPTSVGATSEEGAHPQLSSGHDASADSTAEANLGLSTPDDSIPSQQDQTKSAKDGLKTAKTDSGTNEESKADEISKKIKLEDLSDLLKDTRSAFFTPDSSQDEPIIISDENTLIPHPPSLKLSQIQELMAQPELSKLLASYNFVSFLPTELKELPLKFTELSGEIKELKQHVKDMEIELPRDLKEFLTKIETFTSTISCLTSQVSKLKFATVVDNASGATSKDVPSVDQATTSPAEGEKNTKDAETNLQNEPVELLGIDMLELLKVLQRQLFRSLEDWEVSSLQFMQCVCLCARFQEDPKTSHLKVVKHIFRYTKGTTHLGLWYPKRTGIKIVVYADSDHAGDYKQTTLALSTTKAEYVSARKACQQALWMKQALIAYDTRLDDVLIMCDNKGAINLSKNPMQHSRTKHIEICHHFLWDNVQTGNIFIKKVSSEDNIADIVTKPLKRESFNYLRLGLGMMEHIP